MHFSTRSRDLKAERIRNTFAVNANLGAYTGGLLWWYECWWVPGEVSLTQRQYDPVWRQPLKLIQVDFCDDMSVDGFRAKSPWHSANTIQYGVCLRRTAYIPDNHSPPPLPSVTGLIGTVFHSCFVYCTRNIFEFVPSRDAEVGIYVIIMKLPNSENFCLLWYKTV
jgi:hypothetical protein